ncbi:hypothetical protein FKW77_002144 [Venturia effusa]|uniref:Ubiquitin-related modifier 1 n=1 Tax=Venturia effusa TaxID=50376 RepID=A0A517LJR3_9PEZI|nr:hypothetical protein FKW77_002144 [Venturia effusa]
MSASANAEEPKVEVVSRDVQAVPITVEFTGGLEMLFSHKRKHEISIPLKEKSGSKPTVQDLVQYLCDNLMKDTRKELFVLDDSVRPGILVLINDADWELEGEASYELQKGDNILFKAIIRIPLSLESMEYLLGPVDCQIQKIWPAFIMSIFGSTRAPASAIQLTSEDVKSQGQARRDKRPPRRRPRHVVIPGESDPIIAHHIAEMIEFLASYDDLIPGFYQKYTPTVYGNDDEDRPISVVQRLWILRCIVVGEYDCLTVTEMRSCFRQHFDEQVLEDKQALVQSSLLDLVDYFKMLSREAKQKLNTTIDLEIVSKHHKVLWGSKFDIPDLLVDTSRYTSPTEEPSKDARTRVSSSTTDVHRSGLFNESRLAIALGSPALTARHSPGSGEIPNLPTPPPRVHVPDQPLQATLLDPTGALFWPI